jgi:hypothetical protein
MNGLPPQNWTVAQVLFASPQAAQVFFRMKTDCVGCVLNRFCSLEEVARSYHLELDLLMDMLHQTANLPQPRE